jgi:enamidase
MVSVGHFGPPSIPGSTAMDADAMIALDVDVVAHANGGSTSGNWADAVRLVDKTEKIIELAFTGNPKALLDIADRMATRKALERVILGSDTPVGSGLMPLGILRIIVMMCALGEMAPETAICLATGNTARVYGLSSGVLVEGRDADVLLVDAPHGSYASDFSSAARRGDNPGIAMIMIDGSIVTFSPENTLPSNRQATIRIDE